ncbi:uncharacterized protein RAG0_13649 [Rhynchosporium agropyri]|uniref:Uncharacterized protein n=1 Tax=Rhynchosporium agropyri TaxID=914238 RepID=A0A1E1LDP7_9HELO|nr:uncharacterized protein RAG0_13649 [Rhynchosporium agropyri]
MVKDEEWIGLCGSKIVVVVMEDREQQGACREATLESQESLLAEGSKPDTCVSIWHNVQKDKEADPDI